MREVAFKMNPIGSARLVEYRQPPLQVLVAKHVFWP